MDWRQAAGPCLARALAQTLWAGEGFYLQARAARGPPPGAAVLNGAQCLPLCAGLSGAARGGACAASCVSGQLMRAHAMALAGAALGGQRAAGRRLPGARASLHSLAPPGGRRGGRAGGCA